MITILRRRVIGKYEVPFEKQYLTFEALEPGTFQFTNDVDYSLDGKTWTTLTASTDSPTLNIGDTIRWRATLVPNSTSGIGNFSSTCNYNVFGNPLSLRLGDNFKGVKTLPNNTYLFYRLFYNNDKLINALNLSLPCTTLRERCYALMFYLCPNLVSIPELPAKRVEIYSYDSMFNGCTSLTYMPELPATTLTHHCYYGMFQGCTALTTVKELPFTGSIPYMAYSQMFYNCTSLETAPYIAASDVLGTNTETNGGMRYMFYNCTSLKTIPRMPTNATGLGSYIGTFQNCTSLVSIPEIHISGVAQSRYMFMGCTSLKDARNVIFSGATGAYYSRGEMFSGCTSLEYAPEVLTETSTASTGTYFKMFYGCTSLKTAPIINLTSTTGNQTFESMFEGCTSLTTFPSDLLATTITNRCYYHMFYGCTSLETAPNISATTRSATGNRNELDGMFYNCTSLKTPPAKLSLSTTGIYTYGNMFRGCTSLENVPEITTTQFGDYACRYMFYDCTKITSTGNIIVTSLGTASLEDMFANCTSLISASDMLLLPDTLTTSCYAHMFDGCSSLNSVPELPATTLALTCYYYMFRNTAITKAPELPALTLASLCYYSMFFNCNNLNYIKCWAIDKSATNSLTNWVFYVSSTGTFIKNLNVTWSNGNNGIPSGWTVIDNCIKFKNKTIKNICVQNWGGANPDSGITGYEGEITYEQAAAVTSIGTKFLNLGNIDSFDELKYFTGLTSLNDNCFLGTNFEYLHLPSGITNFRDYKLHRCNITNLGVESYLNVGQTITNFATLARSIKTYYSDTLLIYDDCVYEDNGNNTYTLKAIPPGKTTIEFKENITTIDRYAGGLSSIVTLNIPNTVTTLNYSCFLNALIEDLFIPNSISIIANTAFKACKMQTVVLPNSITKLDFYAFQNCTNLLQIEFTSTTPPTIYDNSLSGTTAVIYVPNEVYQDYLTAWADRSFIDRVQPKESE